LAKDKLDKLSPEMDYVFKVYKEKKRIMPVLKYHRERETLKSFPEALKRVNKNVMNKILSEYI
jgi:predicted exporter